MWTWVWFKVKRFGGLSNSMLSIDSIIHDIIPFAKRKSSRSIIAKLVVAATTYFIWQERNNRMFKKSKRSVEQVADCIINVVRLKLLSCKWKKSKVVCDIIGLSGTLASSAGTIKNKGEKGFWYL
ncbi:hypothetical protein Tco_1098683 [Tanacetum coccineum]